MPASEPALVRVGIVGCGVVASAYYLPWLMHAPGVEITAVCDSNRRRSDACMRLFGARASFDDYYEMLARTDVDAVFILTGPGTHVDFTLAALDSGRHVLIQKPMAIELDGARQIREATRRTGLKVLVEPSDHSPLDPFYVQMRDFVRGGVLGRPYWFNLLLKGPEKESPSLGGNPYGEGAFYAKDSGGMLFDFPYGPNQVVSLLGSCKSVSGLARNSMPERMIVPDRYYDEFLEEAEDPEDSNYWRVVFDRPRDQAIRNEAPDNVFSMYEMHDGSIGIFHTPRLFLPTLPGTGYGGLQIFGTEGNIVLGGGHRASIITKHRELLPSVHEDGWYHIEHIPVKEKAPWPIPPKGAWNYYHESSRHFLECIREDREPIPNVDWGFHITEMMCGALESARTGQRYEMTSTVEW